MAARFGRAEQVVGVLFEQVLAVGKVIDRGQVLARFPALTAELVQDFQNGVDGGQHVRFGAAQRGQAQGRQTHLQGAQILLAHVQIVHQVARTLAEVGMGGVEQRLQRIGNGDHLLAQLQHLLAGGFDVLAALRGAAAGR